MAGEHHKDYRSIEELLLDPSLFDRAGNFSTPVLPHRQDQYPQILPDPVQTLPNPIHSLAYNPEHAAIPMNAYPQTGNSIDNGPAEINSQEVAYHGGMYLRDYYPANADSYLSPYQSSQTIQGQHTPSRGQQNDTRPYDSAVSEYRTPTSPHQNTTDKPIKRTIQKRVRKPDSARMSKFYARLAAVNGVVIPSKLPPGTAPLKAPRPRRSTVPETARIFECPICEGSFHKNDHVKSHFPNCVETNGNPEGKCWDDGLPKKRGPKPVPAKETPNQLEDENAFLRSQNESLMWEVQYLRVQLADLQNRCRD